MADTVNRQVWVGRGIYLALAFLVIFLQLLPLDQRPRLFSAPDVLLALTLVWVARRPEFAPFYMIGAVFFLADLLFQRPPGLFAAIVLMASEFIRSRARARKDTTIIEEFGMIAIIIIMITAANRATLALVLTPQAYQVQALLHLLATLVAVPFVMAFAQYIFGVRRPAPGQTNSLGQRI